MRASASPARAIARSFPDSPHLLHVDALSSLGERSQQVQDVHRQGCSLGGGTILKQSQRSHRVGANDDLLRGVAASQQSPGAHQFLHRCFRGKKLGASTGAQGACRNANLSGVAIWEHDDRSSSSVPDSAVCRFTGPDPYSLLRELGQTSFAALRRSSGGRSRRPSGTTSRVKTTLVESRHGGMKAQSLISILVGGSGHVQLGESLGAMVPSARRQAAKEGGVRQSSERVALRQGDRHAQHPRQQGHSARPGGGQPCLRHQSVPRRQRWTPRHHTGHGSLSRLFDGGVAAKRRCIVGVHEDVGAWDRLQITDQVDRPQRVQRWGQNATLREAGP